MVKDLVNIIAALNLVLGWQYLKECTTSYIVLNYVCKNKGIVF